MTEAMLVQATTGGHTYNVDLMGFMRPIQLMVELTSKCNLRCAYCAKAIDGNDQLPGRNEDMPPAMLAQVRALVERVHPRTMMLCGTGETTFLPGWMEAVSPYLGLDTTKTSMISNFGRLFDDAELDVLSRLNRITISIDTPDAELLAKLRRKVDLGRICYNLTRLRAKVRQSGRPGPEIVVNCTLTTANALHMRELAVFCAMLGVHQVTYSTLFEMDGLAEWVQGVEHLPPDQLAEVAAQVQAVQEMAPALGIAVSIQPRLFTLLSGVAEEQLLAEAGAGTTRVCLQPWAQYTIAADGKIYPCCVTQEWVDQVSDQGNPLDSDGIRAFRKRLLTGDIPDMCRGCSNAPLGSVNDLQSQVALTLIKGGAATQIA